ncbi:MAG: glycine cleavage system aminomethyltransferase GcvT [Gammaproteobacteria bacterium]|nr:glycine cleavage system aminomethyltransferase GcvT [Gammaproteobacteria bacterium]
MGRRTSLYDLHCALGARMVDFGGWDMPLQYGSQIAEHHAVRRGAGLFDVSHMGVIDLHGADARPLLEHLLSNDVGRLREDGRCLYSCMLNEAGGILDDLIVCRVAGDEYRLVVNAATRAKDLAWISGAATSRAVTVRERTDLAILAVQGPLARERAAALLAPDDARRALALPSFAASTIGGWFVSRTGYTGEDGFEVMLPSSEVEALWRALCESGVTPCGLGARDTLRLEAGLALYGQDMDENTNPFESALGWTVALDGPHRAFVGRPALERSLARGDARRLAGLLLDDRGVLRAGQRVHSAAGDGVMTSGGYSPTLDRSIGFARLPAAASGEVSVEVRGKLLRAHLVTPPFVRRGRVLIDLNPQSAEG